jgi:predicted aspartyl protease
MYRTVFFISVILISAVQFSDTSEHKIQSDNTFSVLYAPESKPTAVTIPLKRAGNLLLIDGTADGISGAFVFDTGAPGLVLNATYFRDNKKTYDTQGKGVTGQEITRHTKRVENFEFSGIEYKKITADVIDLGHIENSKGIKILGLIGTKFLRNHEAVIDIKDLSLQLLPVDKKGNLLVDELKNTSFDFEYPIKLVNNVIISNIPIGGKNVCFCIDTGAEQNVMDPQNPNEVMRTISVTSRRTLSGASSEKIEVLFGQMQGFEIMGCTFDNMPVVITDLAAMRAGFGINIRGMLGFPFLEQGITHINVNKKVMSIKQHKSPERTEHE